MEATNGLSIPSSGIIDDLGRVLQQLGLNMRDANLEDTPKRILKSWLEMFDGMYDTNTRAAKILGVAFPGDYDEMVLVRNVRTNGLCPHHFFPIEYTVTVGYLPNEQHMVVGLSKIPRLVELLAHRPVLQEQLTTDIAGVLNEYLKPRGCGVVITGMHGCTADRGVKQHDADMVTSKLIGEFRTLSDVRTEFLHHARTQAHTVR